MPSKSFWDHPIEKIEEALSIRKQIAALQDTLSDLFGSEDKPATTRKTSPRKGKRTMSAATIAKMRASQQARWAKKRAMSPASAKAPAAAPKKKRKLSPEGRARIVAALKARWAKKKQAGK